MPDPHPLSVLLKPRDTLPVLAHIAANPAQPPALAVKELRMGNNTWYGATRNLERLGLVAPTRGPAGRKVKTFHVTPEGEKILAEMGKLWSHVADSRAGLEWELAMNPPAKGSPRAGEVLCRLVEHAERLADFDELRKLQGVARGLHRPGEALMARQVRTFLTGQQSEARAAGEKAVTILRKEENSRSLRKAKMVFGATAEYLGDSVKANNTFIEVRRLAKRAGDRSMEAEAWLGIGILQSRLGHQEDGVRHMRRALDLAESEGLEAKRAKILGNLCFAEAFIDERKGMATADQALKAARTVGARVLIARAQLNRALLLAVLVRREDSQRALREAIRLFAEGGEEKGDELLKGWIRLVRQILRRRRTPSPIDWKGQALSLARTRPRPSPRGPQE